MVDVAVDMNVLAEFLRQPRLQQRLEQRVRPLADGERLHQPVHPRRSVLEQNGLAGVADCRDVDRPALGIQHRLRRQHALVDHRLFPANRGTLDGGVLEVAGRFDGRRRERRLVGRIVAQPVIVVRAVDAHRRRRHRDASRRGERLQEGLLLRYGAHCPIPSKHRSRAMPATIVPPSFGKYRGAKYVAAKYRPANITTGPKSRPYGCRSRPPSPKSDSSCPPYRAL